MWPHTGKWLKGAQCGQDRPQPCQGQLAMRVYTESAKQGRVIRNSEQDESHERREIFSCL